MIRAPIRSFECKPRYIYEASPFERCLFLDADTFVAQDVTNISSFLIGMTSG